MILAEENMTITKKMPKYEKTALNILPLDYYLENLEKIT